MKKTVLFIIFLFFIASTQAQITGYNIGDTVDDFTIVSIDGDSINLYDITASGQYVYIDFFFVDCGPCQVTAPHFNELHERYGCNEGDIYCMSVNTGQDDDDYVETYEEDYGGDYAPCPITSGDGDAGDVNTDFNPAYYPTICLIGPDNKLLNSDIWPITSYQTFVDALVDEGFTPELMECSAVGIEEIEEDYSLVAYPNPANNFVKIELQGKSIDVKHIDIINSIGQNVLSINDHSETVLTIDVTGFDQGLYIVNITDHTNQRRSVNFSIVR